MKDIKTAITLFLPVFLLLSSCSPKVACYSTEDVQTLLDAGAFTGEMVPVDGDLITLIYGIDENTVSDCAGYQAINTAASADEVAVLILTDEDAAQQAEAACKTRVENQIKVCQTYCPAAVPSLQAAVIDRIGNTVLLAVGDPEVLPEAVEQLHNSAFK